MINLNNKNIAQICKLYDDGDMEQSSIKIRKKYMHKDGSFSVFDLEGNLIEGDLPISKQKLVSAWAEIHKEELQANWELCLSRDSLFKINPLQ